MRTQIMSEFQPFIQGLVDNGPVSNNLDSKMNPHCFSLVHNLVLDQQHPSANVWKYHWYGLWPRFSLIPLHGEWYI